MARGEKSHAWNMMLSVSLRRGNMKFPTPHPTSRTVNCCPLSCNNQQSTQLSPEMLSMQQRIKQNVAINVDFQPDGCPILCSFDHFQGFIYYNISEHSLLPSWCLVRCYGSRPWQSSRQFCNNTTTTVLRPFVRDYPGEPVPEETLTHPPSWSSYLSTW